MKKLLILLIGIMIAGIFGAINHLYPVFGGIVMGIFLGTLAGFLIDQTD